MVEQMVVKTVADSAVSTVGKMVSLWAVELAAKMFAP
jgi:hypothetical protein